MRRHGCALAGLTGLLVSLRSCTQQHSFLTCTRARLLSPCSPQPLFSKSFMILTHLFHFKDSTPFPQEERRSSHSQASTSESPSNGDQPANERVLARSKSLLDPQGIPVAASDDDRPTSGDMGNTSRGSSQHAARGNGKQGKVHAQEQRVKDAITVAGEKMQVSGACMHHMRVTACWPRHAALCKADTLLASQLQSA